MSYVRLKSVIVISNNVNLAHKFMCDFIQWNTRSAFSQIIEKLWQQRPPASYARKKYSNIILQN